MLEKQAQEEQEALDRKRREEEERVEAEAREQERARPRRKRRKARKRAQSRKKQARKTLKKKRARLLRKPRRMPRRKDAARKGRGRCRARRSKEKKAKPKPSGETRYGRKELHVAGDKSGRRKRKAPTRRRPVSVGGDSQHGFERPTAPVIHEVEIPESISVAELAQTMAIKGNEVVKVLFNMGAMVTINQVIDQDTATLVVEELGHVAKPVSRRCG